MIQAVLYSFLGACANLLGGLIILSGGHRLARALDFLTAFGGGFMLAVAILEMLPEAAEIPAGLPLVLVGYLTVHLTQHALTPHFHFGEETHVDAMVSRDVGIWALIGLLPHSFFDGVAIAAGFLTTMDLGVLVSTAIFLHKVPTGISLASIMMASGNTRRQALWSVIAIGVATIIGAVVTPTIGVLARYGLGLAAGVTIYVAASNLIPEVQKRHGWEVSAGLILGIGAFFLVKLILPGH